jgi:signal peptidase I
MILIIAKSIAVVVMIGVILCIMYEPMEVSGDSMLPTLKSGDVAIIKKLILNNLKSGDIVVIKTPDYGDYKSHLAIKRIKRVKCDALSKSICQVWVEGDNPAVSFDSRYYGWIDSDKIIGRVIKVWKRNK